LDAAELSAQAALVSDYFQLRYEDSLQTLLTRTLAAYQRTLDITRNQYEAGVAAASDVVTAETQLQATQAQLIAVGVSRAQFEHAIALLMGRTPSQLTVPIAPLSATVPDVPLVVPSMLLERRPDVAQAEREVAQQSALIGVAVAAYYPDVSLSGVFGYASTAAGGLITASNKVWSGAVSGSQLLFDGGARRGAVAAARAGYDQSVTNYREVVLSAFGEVEDGLSSLRVLAEQAEAEHRAAPLSRRAVDIAVHEYEAGLQSYTTVAWRLTIGRDPLPLPVFRENVIFALYNRMTREPALRVVRLRRLVSQAAGPEGIGRGVILELGISPAAAVREPFNVLHHEVHVMLGVWCRRVREELVLFRNPMDLRHPGAVGERLAVAGNA